MDNFFVKSSFRKSSLLLFAALATIFFQWPVMATENQPMNLVPVSKNALTQQNQSPSYLYPVADAYVYAYAYRNWNRSNRGKYEQLVAGWHPVGGESRTYIRFDLNGVDPSSVHRAILRLYHTGTYGNDGVKLGIYRVSDPWMEGWDTYHSGQVEKTAAPGVLSWVQQPVFNNSVIATFNPGMANNNWVEVDITPLVKQWLAGFQNNGLLIKPAGNMYSGVPESTYHFASREVADKNHWPVLILNGPPVSGSSVTSVAVNPNHAGTVFQLGATRWQPHSNGTSICNVLGNQLCIQSQQAGGAWFTTPRSYGFGQDYTVSFDVKLNTANNHFPVLYSDGFVFVDIDWGTTLGHYQPGLAYNLKQLNSLSINQWYHIRVEAHPAKKSFDLYLDNKLVSTATNIKPLHSYHTLSSVINRNDIIWFGDADDLTYRGGNYNHGDVCWRNIRVNIAGAVPAGKVQDVWALNNIGNIYRLNARLGWDHIPGQATDIGVGANGTVWIIGKQNVSGSYDIERWMGTQFVKVPGGAVRVDVGPWGTPWVVNASGDIYYWKNKVWSQIPGKATDIGVGTNGTVWVIGNKTAFGGFEIFRWTGSQFVKVPGAAVRIDVGPDGSPWAVNSFNVIFHRENNIWQKYPGLASDISVANDGTPWIIGTDKRAGGHSIFRWDKNKRNWVQIPGGATAISVGGMHKGNLSMPVSNKYVYAVAKPCGSNTDFVRSLYQSILGRDMLLPLQAGHGLGHVQTLQNGVPRKQIITNFFHSPEYQNKHKLWSEFIKDAYQACLGRNPSAAEVKAWHQNNYDQALQVFFNSREYSNLMANCPHNYVTANSLSLSGTWNLNQDNGYNGTMKIQQGPGNHFTGHVIWNGYLKGTVDGNIVGNVINFTIDYHNGDIGYYKGILTQNKIQISNGTAKGNNGVSAHWSASKTRVSQNNSTNNILGQWKWFTGTVVIFYANGTARCSDGAQGLWKVSPDGMLVINWSNGADIDRMRLNGNKLVGTNQNGTVITANRIVTKKPVSVVTATKIITTNKPAGNMIVISKLFNHDIVGQWKWNSGSIVSIYPDGKVKNSDGNTGTWATGGSTDIFVIHWTKGQNVDRLLLKDDKLKGKNQKGTKVSAKKIVIDFKSGKYRVEQYIGSTYKSTWKLQVKKDKITGKSDWACCPGPRTDPVRGYINGYTVVIERDCSGQNWSGACRQKFVGTLMGSKIEGTCTGTGIVGTGRWILYLK